jgi:hypothetical protein
MTTPGGRRVIELRIRRVVLDGFALDRRELALTRAAIVDALTERFTAGGVPESWSGAVSHPTVRAPGIGAAARHPARFGAQIGAAVHHGITAS